MVHLKWDGSTTLSVGTSHKGSPHIVFFYHFLLTCNIIIASLVELSHVKLQADDCKHEDGHK